MARIKANARVVAIAAGCLVVAGAAVVLWAAVWGVHGCDETEACFRRMDRDFRAYNRPGSSQSGWECSWAALQR